MQKFLVNGHENDSIEHRTLTKTCWYFQRSWIYRFGIVSIRESSLDLQL